MPKFTDTPATNDSYAGLNLTVEVNGEHINLGSLFVTNKGATAVAKKLYELIESGELDPNKPKLLIKGVFSSDNTSSDIDASSF